MSQPPRVRRPNLYRAALLLPIIVLAVLVATGRFQGYFRVFFPPHPASDQEFKQQFITAIVWVVAILPSFLLALELGRQHTSARRLGYDFFIGMREVFRIALRGHPTHDRTAEFARPPQDKPMVALLLGLGVALLIPAFFASVDPALRTPRALLWLGGAGVLMGVFMYCHRRAAAYLVEEPGAWDFFRQWRLLNAARYHEAGRPFVRLQIVASLLLPFWWMVGGAFVLWNS